MKVILRLPMLRSSVTNMIDVETEFQPIETEFQAAETELQPHPPAPSIQATCHNTTQASSPQQRRYSFLDTDVTRLLNLGT